MSPNWIEIERVLQEGVNLLMFCNPGNPQGNVWKKEDVQKIVSLSKKYNCALLIDEIYCDLIWNGSHFSPIDEELNENIVVCRGFSKTLGTQSWRIGFIVSHSTTIESTMRMHDPIYISVPWLQHAVGRYLSENYDDFEIHVKNLCELISSNWNILSKAFSQAFDWEPIHPSGSMYGMFKHKSKTDSAAIEMALRKGVGIAPGTIFFPPNVVNTGYVRIHCGITSEKASLIAKNLLS